MQTRSSLPKRSETLPSEKTSSSNNGAGRRNPRHSSTLPTPSGRVSAFPNTGLRPKKDDKIILVMGASGSGKSSFISTVTGQKEAVAGHGLKSFTQDVQPIRCRASSLTNVVLVDTPGFADTARSDADVLETITSWLANLLENGGTITGLLFFHRISDVRMSGQSLRNLIMFQKLCGERAFGNVALVTTMWDKVDPEVAARRESELKQEFWKTMLQRGAQVARLDHKNSASSRPIIDLVRHKPGIVLAIQREVVVEHKRVLDTAAGSVVADALARVTADNRRTLAALEADAQSALARKDHLLRQRIAQEKLHYQRLLEESIAAQNRLAATKRPFAPREYSDTEHSSGCFKRLFMKLFGR